MGSLVTQKQLSFIKTKVSFTKALIFFTINVLFSIWILRTRNPIKRINKYTKTRKYRLAIRYSVGSHEFSKTFVIFL